MIKNSRMLDLFERDLIRRTAVDFRQNLKIYEALYREARCLGVFPLRDPLDGIDSDIHLARLLNVRKTA
jgi:hypothetical protein